MSFRVTYDAQADCVVTRVEGELDKEVVQAFFAEMGRVATENRCARVLSDLREAKIVASTTDIYRMAQSLEDKKIGRSFRRAIVVSRDEEDYAFWETVCFNQGFQSVRLFHDYEDANRWVTGS